MGETNLLEMEIKELSKVVETGTNNEKEKKRRYRQRRRKYQKAEISNGKKTL